MAVSDTLTHGLEEVYSKPSITFFILALFLPNCVVSGQFIPVILRVLILYENEINPFPTEEKDFTKMQIFSFIKGYLDDYPLNPAYLVVENHEELTFDIDIEGVFK